MIVIIFFTNKRGTGFWKLNCSLLQDADYKEKVRQIIRETAENNANADPNWKWETIKMAIHSGTIEYSSRKQKDKENKIALLENKLNRLENTSAESPSEQCTREIKKVKEDLETYIADRTRGAMVRSRARWIEEGEHSTKYFFQSRKKKCC